MSSEVTRILQLSLPETLSPRRSTNGKSTEKDLEHPLEWRSSEARLHGAPYDHSLDRRTQEDGLAFDGRPQEDRFPLDRA
jgi:hypothetical protein